jgi:hypothetical protein
MPRQELTKTDEEKMVDLDVTGPAVDVELPEKGAIITEVTEEVKTSPQETAEEIKVEEVEEPKQELEDYSKNVQQRINKLTARLREAERREQAATDYAQNVQKENSTLKNRNTALDGNYIIEFANRITTETEAAKAALKQATENDDVDKQVESQQKLARLAVEAQNLKKLNDQRKVRQNSPKSAQTTEFKQSDAAPAPPDPKAEAWARKNAWFGEDTAMTMTSFVVHRQLTEEEGFDPSSDQYYNEVDKRMREEFPHKFNGASSEPETRPVQTVASATRSPKKGRSKTVRLTPSQVAIANKLGVPLEEYAKYVKE